MLGIDMDKIDDRLMSFITILGFRGNLAGRLLRIGKLFASTFVMYWGIRAPLQILFTEYFGIWYVTGNFMAGIILTVMGFMISEFWIWREK